MKLKFKDQQFQIILEGTDPPFESALRGLMITCSYLADFC